MSRNPCAGMLLLLLAAALSAGSCIAAPPVPETTAAPARYRADLPVLPISNTTLLCEAEEFHVVRPGWRARPWGTNYYAATFANTFLSRKAYLGAPEQTDGATATLNVQVPRAGQYLALVRYEAVPRFQTQFRLRIEQGGQVKLDRLYGALENEKIWAFGKKIQKEVIWSWGAVENMVWEGHDTTVDLQAGPARLTLIANRQPEPAARRNVDCILLTTDREQVERRIQKEGYLPLDGMLTQAGDVYFRLHDHTGAPTVRLQVPNGIEHSSYWVHIRDWQPRTITAGPGEATGWTEVGSLLDTLNDGQWRLKASGVGPLAFDLEVGLRTAGGAIKPIRRFPDLHGDIELAYDANTRYTHRVRTTEEILADLVSYLRKRPVRGRAPDKTLIYGETFDERPKNTTYTALRQEFIRQIGATAIDDNSPDALGPGSSVHGMIDVRGESPEQLEALGHKLQAEGKADRIAVVSLGDEIGLASPPDHDDEGFRAWLQEQGVTLPEIDPAAHDWSDIHYNLSDETAGDDPGILFYSRRYQFHYGILAQKKLTDVLRRCLPNAGIGANYSPQGEYAYLGSTHQWVSLFREGGMTLPWSEDYVWGVPIGTQQMSFLSLDLFRAGIRGHPEERIMMYVMPHWPGNTPDSWRRQFYGALAHGAKILDLFEFRPVQAAYTENHVSLPAMYQEVRQGLHELGLFEDLVQAGQVTPGVGGLWFSETADVWDDNHHPFDAGKRTLYAAIRHQQLPLDVVVEDDALHGSLAGYRVIYLSDRHVSQAASHALAAWVQAGGRIFATAGAGTLDEFNRPNTILMNLFGIRDHTLEEAPGDPIRLEKQDLPFARPVDRVTLGDASGSAAQETRDGPHTPLRVPASPSRSFPVFGVRSRFTAADATVVGRFRDGSPAVVTRRVGAGTTTFCGFLPGLSYFKPAIPVRPVDRATTDDGMDHFIPTAFDPAVTTLFAASAAGIARPVVCSEPLVETTVIEAPGGTVIQLINWSAGRVRGLQVTVHLPVTGLRAALASGRPVRTADGPAGPVYSFDLDVADALILRK